MRSKNGFTLIEVLIVMGIMSVVALGFAQMLTTQMRFQKQVGQSMERNQFGQFLSNILNDANNCPCQFTGHTIFASTANVTGIQDLKSTCGTQAQTIANGSAPLPGSETGLKVSDISLVQVTPAGANTYTARLQVQFDPASTVVSLHPVSQPLVLQTDNTGKVITCSNAEANCLSLGGIWNGTNCSFSLNPASACQSLGGTWTGSSCTSASNPAANCQSLGGTWNGSSCSLTNLAATCVGLGGNWNGSTCGFKGASNNSIAANPCPAGTYKNPITGTCTAVGGSGSSSSGCNAGKNGLWCKAPGW